MAFREESMLLEEKEEEEEEVVMEVVVEEPMVTGVSTGFHSFGPSSPRAAGTCTVR